MRRDEEKKVQCWFSEDISKVLHSIAETERRTVKNVVEILVEFSLLQMEEEGLNLSEVCRRLNAEKAKTDVVPPT